MERLKFTVDCPGEPCPLQRKPSSHSHMPPQERLPNNLQTDPGFTTWKENFLKHSYDGLVGDEDLYELSAEVGKLASLQVVEVTGQESSHA